MNPKISNVLIILFFGLLGNPLNLFPVQSLEMKRLHDLALACFDSKQQRICYQALTFSEALQRQAGNKGNYPCQTSALGLGADLIMASKKREINFSQVQMLEEVRFNCKGI